MATVPSPSTQTASAVVTSTLLNNHRDALQFLLGSSMTGGGGRRPVTRARLSVAQSLATSGTGAALLLDVEDVDYDAMHSTVTNTSRLTAVTAGWYSVSANVAFAANATGQRLAYFVVNGGAERAATRVEHAAAGSAVPTCISTHADFIFLNAADYVELFGLQTSGGALNVTAACLTAEWRSN